MGRVESLRSGSLCTETDMFGNFNLNAGLSQLQDLGGRFQKIKEDLEQNIESSLRTNIAPAAGGNTGDDSGAAISSADGSVAFGGDFHAVVWPKHSRSTITPQCPTKYLAIARRPLSCQSTRRTPLCRILGGLQPECSLCQRAYC